MKADLAHADARRNPWRRARRSSTRLSEERTDMYHAPPQRLIHWIDDAANATVAVAGTLGLVMIIFG